MIPFRTFRDTVLGTRCGGLLAQAYVFHGELVDSVTLVYLQFATDRWARIGIDGGHFHWRETAMPETIPSDGGHSYPLVDLGAEFPIRGRRIRDVRLIAEPEDGATLAISFVEGGVLSLVNANDHTRLFLA